MKDVKNIIEVLEAIEAVGVPAKQALKDGLDVNDLPKLLELVKKYQVLIDAVDNIAEVVDEAKDIDSQEAVQVVLKAFQVAKSIKEA
jgi:predicted RNase H-like nuclease (RuvC/YqgF family)